jgi:hypothetical protein
MPASLNEYCANVNHVRKAVSVKLIKLKGITLEVLLCTECHDRMEGRYGSE